MRAWREFRGVDLSAVSGGTGLSIDQLEAIEADLMDPPVSALERLATLLRIPPSWLYAHPREVALLTSDDDGEEPGEASDRATIDPLLDRILTALPLHRELYGLLTVLVGHADAKLLRAAEVSLRSLLKQARATTVPWQSRPSGHFEPPSD